MKTRSRLCLAELPEGVDIEENLDTIHVYYTSSSLPRWQISENTALILQISAALASFVGLIIASLFGMISMVDWHALDEMRGFFALQMNLLFVLLSVPFGALGYAGFQFPKWWNQRWQNAPKRRALLMSLTPYHLTTPGGLSLPLSEILAITIGTPAVLLLRDHSRKALASDVPPEVQRWQGRLLYTMLQQAQSGDEQEIPPQLRALTGAVGDGTHIENASSPVVHIPSTSPAS